jgi:hypothetical protein
MFDEGQPYIRGITRRDLLRIIDLASKQQEREQE